MAADEQERVLSSSQGVLSKRNEKEQSGDQDSWGWELSPLGYVMAAPGSLTSGTVVGCQGK